MSLMEGNKYVFLNLLLVPYYDMDIFVHVVSPINSVRWLTHLFLFTPVHFPHPGLSMGGKKSGGGTRGKQHGGLDPEEESFSSLEIL